MRPSESGRANVEAAQAWLNDAVSQSRLARLEALQEPIIVVADELDDYADRLLLCPLDDDEDSPSGQPVEAAAIATGVRLAASFVRDAAHDIGCTTIGSRPAPHSQGRQSGDI